jgi:dephospho-CoA kinase
MFRALGAHILSADEIARELMEPGQPVYDQIVATFGPTVVLPDGRLFRPGLARIAFTDNRVDELNAIIHPATIARQAELTDQIAARDRRAIVIVESALIFETKYAGERGWTDRFDKLILVTAPEELRIDRFIARTAPTGVISDEIRATLEADARRRIAQQIPDEQKAALADYVLTNAGALTELEWQVDKLWPLLVVAAT